MPNPNDPTKDLTQSLSTEELLKLIFSRLQALESLVNERLQDTRPMWQAIDAKLDQLIRESAINAERLDVLTLNMSRLTAEHQLLSRRVADTDSERINRLAAELSRLQARLAEIEMQPQRSN